MRMNKGGPVDGLERKFCGPGRPSATEGRDGCVVIEGYASLFGEVDGGGDIVCPGAFAASLERARRTGRPIRMLWQHDPREPIGVWDEIREDARGLRVRGRLLPEVTRGREAAALLQAGALDGLSIGYRVVRASRDTGGRRLLREVELWEISLVTFPMLAGARVGAKAREQERVRALATTLTRAFEDARARLARAAAGPDPAI